MKKYKVIDEYEHFYLCISKNGYRECFNKILYKPDSEGFIYIKDDSIGE